jgi:hypothetical protein
MPYKNWADTDTLNAADLNAMTADPDTVDVAAADTCSITSYGDLANVGPTKAISLVSGQTALVIVSCRMDAPNALAEGFMSFTVSGALTLAALDANGARFVNSGSGGSLACTVTRVTVITATSTATATIVCKYKVTANTFTIRDRRLVVKKF